MQHSSIQIPNRSLAGLGIRAVFQMLGKKEEGEGEEGYFEKKKAALNAVLPVSFLYNRFSHPMCS